VVCLRLTLASPPATLFSVSQSESEIPRIPCSKIGSRTRTRKKIRRGGAPSRVASQSQFNHRRREVKPSRRKAASSGLKILVSLVRFQFWPIQRPISLGVSALENYRKVWNEQLGCWSSNPLHNFASHGADAFRMLAVGVGKLESKGLTATEWRQLRAAHISP
jgi:hypothetical protein